MMDFPGPESLVHAGLDAWQDILFSNGQLNPDFGSLRIDNEGRLAAMLGVDFFLQPPPWEDRRPTTIPWLRFPRWHQCPSCGLMTRSRLNEPNADQHRSCQSKGHQKPRQVRFVAACRHGHLRDFPWVEWLIGKNKLSSCPDLGAVRRGLDTGRYLFRMKSRGSTGGAGVEILLEDPDAGGAGKVIARASLAGAFGGKPNPGPDDSPPPLAAINVRCRGENPALGRHEDSQQGLTECDAPLIVTLRGASNLYFPVMASVIHVPDSVSSELRPELLDLFEEEDLVSRLVEKQSRDPEGKLSIADAASVFNDPMLPYSTIVFQGREIEKFVETFNSIEPFRRFTEVPAMAERARLVADTKEGSLGWKDISGILLLACTPRIPRLSEWRHVPEYLVEGINRWLAEEGRSEGEAASSEDEGHVDPLRVREYRVFSSGQLEIAGLPRALLKIRQPEMAEYSDWLRGYFDHVALIDSLRETRVLRGFDRLQSPSSSEMDYSKLLWKKPPHPESGQRWLPATVVFGEGIFLRFDQKRITEWEQSQAREHEDRLCGLNRSLRAMRERRGQGEGALVTARQLMIHTFSHLLINQLVFSSGYGSASLRERLYVESPAGEDGGMAGLLIYTAAGDSEGSMGGLVRQGEPGLMEHVMLKAIESAMWCASDPICIQSHGQGPDACNLAACHSCALLPETSCEQMNRFLDRGTVIGTLEKPDTGFFSDLCGRGLNKGAVG